MNQGLPLIVDQMRAEAAAMLASSVETTDSGNSNSTSLGYTFGELRDLKLPERDEIFRGLARREVAMLNAVTNVGKTTFVRNLALNLIAGRTFEPLCNQTVKRRVAIIDGEDTLSFLRSDILRMVFEFSDDEKQLVNEHLLLICDTPIGDEDLMLNRDVHFAALAQRLEEFMPDLIIVDTISKCFMIRNENDNSEVKELVMRPLTRLAKHTDAGVIALHHIGKSKLEEGSVREGSHRGRGASAFGDQSRVILNLEKDPAGECVVLSCPKLKGESFADQVFRLNRQSRWFEWVEAVQLTSNYDKVIGQFSDGIEKTTAEIREALQDQVSKRTVQDLLKQGVARGDLRKVRQGRYVGATRNAVHSTTQSADTQLP